VKASRAAGTGTGRAGEELAARLLASEGWTILARNFRAGPGEIDIVAARGEVLAFVEVKTWGKTASEELERAVGRAKKRRIIETSKIFLSRYREYSSRSVRYDLLLLRDGAIAARFESAFTGEL
jgi:putative endonuclease